MKIRKAATIVLAVFMTIMLVFTFFGDDLYRLTLPKVSVHVAKRKNFPYQIETEYGTITTGRMAVAIPKEALQGNKVAVLSEFDDGMSLSLREVEIGEELSDLIEIKCGISAKTKVVIGSDRAVSEGDRVLLSESEEMITLHEARIREEGLSDASVLSIRNTLKKNVRRNWVVVFLLLAAAILCFVLCRLIFRKKLWIFRIIVMMVFCLLACLILKKMIVLPPEWIPDRLIDLRQFFENRRNFPL